MQRNGRRLLAVTALFFALLATTLLRAQEEDDTIDIDALLADDALLDELLFGEAELPIEESPEEETPPASPAPSEMRATGSESEDPVETRSSPGVVEQSQAELDADISEESAPAASTEASGVSLWDWENRVTLGGGYKRNVLFSAFSQEDSAFSLTEWESTLIRLARPRDWQVFAYLVAENRHYVDVEGLDDEWLVVALGQAEKPVGSWRFGLAAQYMYFEQAYRLEFEELDLGATEVALHQFQLTPKMRYGLTDDLYLELRTPLTANLFDDSAQDYDEAGVVAELGWRMANGGRLTLSYGYEYRDFDERTERTVEGDAIAGEILAWEEHVVEMALHLPLGESGRWRSKTHLRYRVVEDGGSGYHDFNQTRASQTIRYEKGPWEASLRGSYTHYDYPVQTKDTGDSNHRYRALLTLNGEVKRSFGEDWEGFVRYDFESYLSNVPEDVYDVHVFTLGLRHTF